MVKTVFLDQFISLLWGSILAITVAPSIKRDGIFTKFFWRGFLFQLLIFFPIGLYLFLTWPDWSWMYWVNNETTPTILKVVALSGYIISFLIGYIASAYAIKKNRDIIAYILAAIGVVGILVITMIGFDRLIHIGTYEEYLKDVAPYVWYDSRFMISMILIGLYFGIPGAILIYRNLKDNDLLPGTK